MSKRSTGSSPRTGIDLAHGRELAALDRRHVAELLASAYRDELTGALTRRAGRQLLAAEVELKQANDARGHAPDIACGGRIPIATFVSTYDEHATRVADCPDCGETTAIRLTRPRGH